MPKEESGLQATVEIGVLGISIPLVEIYSGIFDASSMTARPKLAPEQQMTIEEFLAFTDTRPEEERWELIEGVPVLNPSAD